MFGTGLLWLGIAVALLAIIWGIWTGARLAVAMTELIGEAGIPFEAGQRAWFTLHRRGAFGADCEDRRRILARAHAKVLFRLLSGVIVGLVLMIAGANLR
jgi:hypothetical protein